MRLVLAVLDQLIEVWGAGKVGIRLSPFTFAGDVYDPEAYPVYEYLLQQTESLKLAYIHYVRARPTEINDPSVFEKERQLWKSYDGTLIAADGFDTETAIEYVENGWADAIAFGRNFISNPDLPKRVAIGAVLNPYDRNTFYGGAEKGYTDYPFLKQEAV